MKLKPNLVPWRSVHNLTRWLGWKGQKVTVSTSQFLDWLKVSGLPQTDKELAARTGINRATLYQQLSRDRVPVSTIVAVARAWDIAPVNALAYFPAYRILWTDRTSPSQAEILSQIASSDILAELMSRLSSEDAARLQPGRALQPFPFEGSVRFWLEAIDSGSLRKRLSEATGIASGNISGQLAENRLAVDVALAATRLAGTAPASGLVVTGVLTPREAGWDPDIRQKTLEGLSDVELSALSEARLTQINRVVRRKAQTAAHTDRYLDALG